jgi:hypothetical protein
MSGLDKRGRGKGFSKGGAKRHRHVPRDKNQGPRATPSPPSAASLAVVV